MLPRFSVPVTVGVALLSAPGISRACHNRSSVELIVQRRDDLNKLVNETMPLDPNKTAAVVIDMWDRHWCKTFTARVDNLVPRMNKTLAAARRLGIQVVHAPADVIDFYKDTPQRKAMLAIPAWPAPAKTDFNPPEPPGPTNFCECGPSRPCRAYRNRRLWKRQHPELEIAAGDLIGDCNNGRELLNLCASRGIDTVIYMGVASNMCVQYRSMGICNMKRYGLRVVVVSDLVQAITANSLGPDLKQDRNFTPAKGTAGVQRHIERYLAPTFESRQLIAAAGLDPHAKDPRPHIVFVVAEQEYNMKRTLPTFARKHLEGDFRCTFRFSKGNQGADRNDLPGLEALYDADLLVLAVRRRAFPVAQMDYLERYIRAGKPIVAIRVSIVAFQLHGKVPDGHVVWDRFDKEVLGCNYHGYDIRARQTGCDVWVAPKATDHPIVKHIGRTNFHSPAWLYRQRPLAKTTTVLLEGRWSERTPVEPLAWTNKYHGGRVFYTTLGHPGDFQLEPFNQMLLGAIRWAVSGAGLPKATIRVGELCGPRGS